MPTNRRRREHARVEPEFDGFGLVHLQFGDCFMNAAHEACQCGILGPGGVVNGTLNEALAKRWWREHRDEILAAWKGPGLCWAEERFGR